VLTSSSSAAEKNSKKNLLILISSLILIIILSITAYLFYLKDHSEYTKTTLQLDGSLNKGDNLFKMNCVGCHGLKARGLVGPDLHFVTERLSDSQIITQVTKGLTPPMPSFDIEPQNMADLLVYLHSLN
tara:strand:+ start:1064 stop:1450 length:387 start_codon:yes stop_codon:yes gene_type:complete